MVKKCYKITTKGCRINIKDHKMLNEFKLITKSYTTTTKGCKIATKYYKSSTRGHKMTTISVSAVYMSELITDFKHQIILD